MDKRWYCKQCWNPLAPDNHPFNHVLDICCFSDEKL